MTNKSFFLGFILFVITSVVDVFIYLNGLTSLGIFSFIGTLLVFSSSMIWLIYWDDSKLYFRRLILVVPISFFGVAICFVLRSIPIEFKMSSESLEEVGNLIISRYQISLWMVSILIFFMFIVSSSVMAKGFKND